MIIDDLHLERVAVPPDEAEPPLIVDSDAVLTRAVAAERFQSVPRRVTKVNERTGVVKLHELAVADSQDLLRHAFDEPSFPSSARGLDAGTT